MKQKHTLFKDYNQFLHEHFPFKVQKLSIDGGFGCPNCDGTKGRGGCTYCNNHAFTPVYCNSGDSIDLQIKKGVDFFGKKYPDMKYLAYFQAHTNTYAPLNMLKQKYEEALSQEGIVGLVIGTRPDCISTELLDYLGDLSKQLFVMLEYGIESTSNQVLKAINRGHDYTRSQDAIIETHKRGIYTCAHIILGLPLAKQDQILAEPALISALPLDVLKLHQLQIVKGTVMALQFNADPSQFNLFTTPEEYASLVIDYIERLRPDITLERFTSQSPAEMLIAPCWGMKNYQFVELLKKMMIQRHTWQGKLWRGGQTDKDLA